jgi:hypothetical protein
VVNDEAAAAGTLSRIRDLDRRLVRQAFERRFAVRRMAEDYLRTYQKLAGLVVS